MSGSELKMTQKQQQQAVQHGQDKVSVTIVGGGISGIAQAIHLKKQLGDKLELSIFERKSEAGGVWRDSTWVSGQCTATKNAF